MSTQFRPAPGYLLVKPGDRKQDHHLLPGVVMKYTSDFEVESAHYYHANKTMEESIIGHVIYFNKFEVVSLERVVYYLVNKADVMCWQWENDD